MTLLIVLMRESPSAPPRAAAAPGSVMSPMFGVSFTSTGVLANCLAQLVISWSSLGSCPTDDPIPRSHIPWGQPKLSSSPSQPVSSTLRMRTFQSSFVSVMSEMTTALCG